jgi:methyl-accepting chemotaxis protein
MKSLTSKIIFRFVLVGILCAVLTSAISFYEIYIVSTSYMKSEGTKVAMQIKDDIDLTGISDVAGIQNYLEVSMALNKEIGFVEFVNKQLVTTASSSKDRIGSHNSDKKLTDSMNTGSTGEFLKSDKKMGTMFNILVPLKNGREISGIVSVGMKLDSMYMKIREAGITILMVVLVILLFTLAISILLAKSITRPLNKFSTELDSLRVGDLRVKFQIAASTEITRLGDVMNYSIDNMRGIISDIKQGSVEMDSMAMQLSTACTEYTAASRESLNGVNEVAMNVSSQADNLTTAEDMVKKYGNNLDTVYNRLDKVAKDSVKIKTSADQGMVSIAKVSEALEQVSDSFQTTILKSAKLNESVHKIDEITNMIKNVAGQTNMLALNAAIEAARAGEAGAGFSIVADEIRVLANEVLNSSKNIGMFVKNILKDAEEVSMTSGKASKEMEIQKLVFNETMEKFSGILTSVSEIVPHIKEAENTLERNVVEKDQLLEMIASISASVGSVSKHSDEITGVIQSQTTSISILSELSSSINTLSQTLQSNASKFQV